MAGRGLFDGLSWAMNTDPAVMQASGYVRTRDGVKHSPSEGSEKLAENLAVLSSIPNTLMNVGMAGAVPALVSEAGAAAGSFLGNEAGKYIVENNYVSEDVKPWVIPTMTILGGFFGGMTATKGAGVLKAQKATTTKTAKPEYSNWGEEFIDDVTVNSKQQYLPKQSKLTEGELAGLSKHERTNVRTSPKLDPEKAFEIRLGQKMAQEFTDPGIKEVVRNNPSAGMIMKNWIDNGMSEINAFKKYLAERRSVTRVVGVPASSVEDGVRKLNHVGEKMAREFKPINKTMNGDNIPVTEDGILYTAEYFDGGNYGAPEFVIKQSRGLTKYDFNDYIPASDIPKYIVKREYIMRPKMDFSGNTSTWLENNPPLNAEFSPTTHQFYDKYKNMLDDIAAETSYDYGLRLNEHRHILRPYSEIVFSGKPGELLQMKPVRYRDAYHALIFPKTEQVNTKSLNRLYSWPEIPVGNSAPWREHTMKIVPYAYKQGGTIQKPNFIQRLEDRKKFHNFRMTLPPNLRPLSRDYNMRRYWELWGKPDGFYEALTERDGMFSYENDGVFHANTVGPENEKGEGEFMKSRNHRSLYYETDWYNKGITYDNNGKPIPLQGQERKDWEDFRNRYDLDTSRRFYKYVPRK